MLFYFIKLPYVHPELYTRDFLITGCHVAHLTASFVLALASVALLGVVGEADSPPIKFYPPSGAVGIYPVGLLFLQVVLQTPWNFGKTLKSLLQS